ISFRKYGGLRLPSDCIRFKDNVKGVYVVGAYTAEFVPINIIYEEKEFVLCDDSFVVDGKGLNMYDKVVVEGVVQDGQPIKN
ncbi:MAG: HlyD family efflux transporter periplasmic adaptor subunit, partial [Oscillospiraceae bacterium]